MLLRLFMSPKEFQYFLQHFYSLLFCWSLFYLTAFYTVVHSFWLAVSYCHLRLTRKVWHMPDLQHSPKTTLPMLLYYGIQMCFLYWTGLPTKQLLAIPKVARETLQWKILENFHVPKDCGEVMQRWGCFFTPKLKPETKATLRGHTWARGPQNFSGGDLWEAPCHSTPLCPVSLPTSETLEDPSPKRQACLNIARVETGAKESEWERRGRWGSGKNRAK